MKRLFSNRGFRWIGLLFWVTGFILLAQEAVAGKKPSDNGELFSYEGTMDLSGIKPEYAATFSIGHIKDSSRVAIKIDFPQSEKYPGILFPVPEGGWDLSGFAGVQIEVYNPGTEIVPVSLRVDNEGDWSKNPWSAQIIQAEPGKAQALKVEFGKTFGNKAYPLDPSKITAIHLITNPTGRPFSVLVMNLKAYKGNPADNPAATGEASGKPAEAAGASKPYITQTVSPKNHKVPYGQDWELVKDWTFGKKRADATIRNRAELDKEFYYRYIYENGKLDTLSTYWTVHRDYPENDPRSLHVFGDDTLTLKARVREGEAGGLKKGGLESGMLRGKFPFVPGMYVEMRAKLTKGIGAWPAFWLGCGVQKDDGTFSELPWPPEIDIFEFFNWQGRPKTKVLTANIQTNKQPEKFGNPYTIFSALNKEGDYIPGMDFGEEFHVFALDWQENRPVWILDGHPIKQAYYEWNGPPAHILVTNQLGISFGDIKEMKVDESNWNYVIDYIRVWKKKSP